MPKFKRGDRVRKIKGSQWHGIVVGEYSTELNPEGYCVESEYEKGSVQIYPAAALEHAHASHTAAIREKAEALVAALYGAMSSYAGESDDPCERDEIFIDNFEEELTALKAELDKK